MTIILHAPNVHQGGGASLLTALLNADRAGMPGLVIVDARFALPERLASGVTVEKVSPTIVGRLNAEWRLWRVAQPGDVVLCVGNLPPLLRLRARATLLIQNRFLVDDVLLKGFGRAVRMRICAERFWLRARVANVERLLVQTPTMQRAVMGSLGRRADVFPFLPESRPVLTTAPQGERGEKTFDFLYVSSGEPHKNHGRLIEAWQLLAEEGIRPRLCLTVSPTAHPELCRRIDDIRGKYGLKVMNVGAVPPDKINDLLGDARAFIYPSLLESFGLPLLEAAAAQLPIIASELDYVRDVIDPIQTFDPTSPVSIARAVKRFLGCSAPTVVPRTAPELWEELMDGYGR